MSIAKKASLGVAVVSAMYLTQCQSLPKSAQPAPAQTTTAELPKNTKHQYPQTRVQTDKQDKFRSGEFGRPDALVGDGLQGRNLSLSNERARPDDGVEAYFGEKVVDKYRWLEEVDLISPEYQRETSSERQRNFLGTRLEDERFNGQLDNRSITSLQKVNENTPKSEVTEWVDAQNKVTQKHLEQAPIFGQVQANAKSLFDWEWTIRKVKTDKAGELHFYRDKDNYKRVVRTDKDGKTHELWRETDLDWGLRDLKGDFYPSKDGSYFALLLSTGTADSDRAFLTVFDSMTGKEVFKKQLGGALDFGNMGALWLDDDSFVYGTHSLGVSRLYRHDIGEKRINDPLVISTPHTDGAMLGLPWLEGKEQRYMVVVGNNKGLENVFFIQDLKTGKLYRPYSKKLMDKVRNPIEVFIGAKFVSFDETTGDVWLISGENDDQRGEIIKTNIHNLNKREVVVPVNSDYERILEAVYHKEDDGYFVIKYLKDGQHKVVLTNNVGKPLKDLTPAPTGYADNLSGFVVGTVQSGNPNTRNDNEEKGENYITFRYQNFGLPRTIYKYSIKKDDFIDVRRRDLYPFAHEDYTSELVKYKSKDGTEVPMSITYHKSMVKNGKNPTLMMSYGGFAVLNDTLFRPDMAMFLEMGGIFAQPHIRGGSEYGEKWHIDGNFKNKMKGFDDFEAAADYLHANGYTSPAYTAITGGSNGGLLVGAAMTLAPHKYGVAVPAIAVLDMFRHDQKHYMGRWDVEYGSVYDGKEMYDALKAYSPYHNVKAGVCYPATLVTTSKRDDRVLPFHSYKFVAALQENQGCDNPTYLYAAEAYGHGARETTHRIQYGTAINTFMLDAMGITSVAPAKRPSIEELKGEKWLKEEAEAKAKADATEAE